MRIKPVKRFGGEGLLSRLAWNAPKLWRSSSLKIDEKQSQVRFDNVHCVLSFQWELGRILCEELPVQAHWLAGHMFRVCKTAKDLHSVNSESGNTYKFKNTYLPTIFEPECCSSQIAFSASLLLKEFERKGSCVRLCQLDNRFLPLMVMPAKLLLQGQLQQE